jgi:ribosomal protein S18 acetylase RimI-like enzyme
MWVRTASNRDIAEISKLLGVVWHHTYDDIYGIEKVTEITNSWHNKAALEKLVKHPASEFLVADDGDKIAGMAFAKMINDSQVKLVQLYVLPQFHGKGVGRLLLEEIEESFFEAREFTLEVEEKNTGAIGFYEKHGFTKTGTTQNCGKDGSGIAALIFTKVR